MVVVGAEVRTETTLAVTVVFAGGLAWAAGVHLALEISLASLVLSVALVAAAAFGIGYELGDAGLATALFLGLAVAGAFLSAMLALDGFPGAGMGLAFGTGPALIAAPSAYAGGLRKDR